MTTPIQNVAIFGASGRLGPFILKALVDSKQFTVTILNRYGSTATYDEKEYPGVSVVDLPSDYTHKSSELAGKLKGQDALVVVIPGTMVREQQTLATACCLAKVQRMIPADYGSVDSSDPVCIDLVPLYGKKKQVRDSIQGLSLMYPPFNWTSLISGHFLDYGLESELLGFDASADPPTATIFDDGNHRWSASTRARIGAAVVKLLDPDVQQRTRNELMYIQSVTTTQNEVLALFEKVSGRKWNVNRVSSEEYIAATKKEMETNPGHDPTERMVCVLGVTRANWEDKENFANDLFGFEPESLEDVVRAAWEKCSKK